MPIDPIVNGELNLSVRAKLNAGITQLNGLGTAATADIDDASDDLSKLWSSSKLAREIRALSSAVDAINLYDMRALFGAGELGGYWDPKPENVFTESAGTGAVVVNGVVGYFANAVNGQPAAVQATTANKPFLRRTPTTQKYWLDGNTATAALTATFLESLGSTCTIAKLDPELGVVWSENQTIGTTYNLITPYAYHGPTLVINRLLTAGEKAIVERVMEREMPTLGSEFVVNGTFDTDVSGWTRYSGDETFTLSWDAGGKALLNRVSSYGSFAPDGAGVIKNKAYFTKFSGVKNGYANFWFNLGQTAVDVRTVSSGTYRQMRTATQSRPITIECTDSSGSWTLDNLSVKEVL
jgi:hypothetical protein